MIKITEKLIILFDDNIGTKEILEIVKEIRKITKEKKVKDIILHLETDKIKEYLKSFTKWKVL